jgi:hypothetical protein
VGGASIQIVHYFGHSYLEEEKSMIHSFTVTFEAKYLTGILPFVLIVTLTQLYGWHQIVYIRFEIL